MATNKTNDQNFKIDVLDSKQPVLVDFWAEWCGPCKAIAPSLEELSEEMASKLKIVKINVDENPSISQTYSIRSIPALMIFKDGEKISEKMGALPKSALQSWVNETI
ncbi:MAG: thioredoxin [Alphaproteobacteria bacterium]|jgi:thioredoxin 1|uniref:thioredoxin n=1 Tax=Candidatus Levibacter sp. Uisw_134_01 TaxID=3230999 RepID=UPI002A3B758D|nr:thioredoxin [Pseudomonadota bacterium]MDC3273275.1 thioredoxin [Alphaproteobacteria bacterium]MDG1883219.1 thioredoxin [Alphaproteobacteria bacterium]MDG1982139.1 thioredoxin [Alphaproteobacteria bacterium]MDG2457341.1 thioredoxin [Alphaproteobacteria bacterium]|tara:strand:+ start:264 stop:584 length:321 start_codon:yes stop_codon:yes gene_type:complete